MATETDDGGTYYYANKKLTKKKGGDVWKREMEGFGF